jgi:hypothetical protein
VSFSVWLDGTEVLEIGDLQSPSSVGLLARDEEGKRALEQTSFLRSKRNDDGHESQR